MKDPLNTTRFFALLRMTSIFGYENLLSDFKKLAETGALSHAYLFYGEPETGKFLFAQTLAQHIASPSDIHVIDFLSESPSTDSTSSPRANSGQESAGIEKVRELEHFLYQTPSISETESPKNHRVAIIRDAQWLTDQAQNALLKILEEPPKAGIMLATATDPDIFLPAVRSRFQLVFMPVLPQERILDFLSQYDIIDSQKKNIAGQAHGRVGRAKKIAEAPEKNRVDAVKLAAQAVRAGSGTEKKKVSDAIIEFFDEHPANPEFFIEAFTEELRKSPRNAPALKALCEFAYHLQTVTIQKRIHLKKILWMIQ